MVRRNNFILGTGGVPCQALFGALHQRVRAALPQIAKV
jgi:hypothetical protein